MSSGSAAERQVLADTGATSYRADIDGLRALAVLAVVVFHLSHTALPGGYLGVDIFFVISGFLITGIIAREMEAKAFSLLGFYERRLRRIMPALLVVLLASTVAGYLLLLPSNFTGYADSLLASLAFVANFYFFGDSGYFAAEAATKPLLHIWSLGVEEQFYLVFPLILALTVRPGKRWISLCLVGLLVVGSFALNWIAVNVGAHITAFYMLPARFWEMGVGAMLALLPAARQGRGQWLMIPALSLVVTGLVLHLELLVPTVPAGLPVVVGTAILIRYGTGGAGLVTRLFESRPAVFFGRISYSLYLWHWPVCVYLRYWLTRDLTLVEMLGAFALMTGLAALSLRYIETPSRRSLGIRPLLAWTGVAVIALVAAAMAIKANDGYPGRFSGKAAVLNQAVDTHYHCPDGSLMRLGPVEACPIALDGPDPAQADVILFGNSHAQMYAPLVASEARRGGRQAIMVPLNGCLPTVSVNLGPNCFVSAQAALDAILAQRKAKTVIVGTNWAHDSLVAAKGGVVDNRTSGPLADGLADLAGRLQRAGKTVILIGPIEQPNFEVASEYSRQLAFGRPHHNPDHRARSAFDARHGAALGQLARLPDVRLIRPDKVQCDAQQCRFILAGRALFSDGNHLAQGELWRFAPLFEGLAEAR